MKAVRIAKDAYHKIINTNERVNQISEHFILGGVEQSDHMPNGERIY